MSETDEGAEASMEKPERIQATRVCDLEEISASRHVVTVTAGPQHDLVVLSLDGPPDYRRIAPSGCSFAKLRADRPNYYRIDHFLDSEWNSLTLPATKENFHRVQPLGKNGWLLMRGRAKGETDRNAHVHNPDGTHGDSFHAGDGIENVQTTGDSRIWISFFDQGVFGDTALGRAGLACLDNSGQVQFKFNDLAEAGAAPDIADCYAFNVCSDREVWLCYYTDFPLVRLVDRQVARIWPKVAVQGAHAFAVSGQRVLFAGMYEKRNSLFLADLDTTKVQERVPVNDAGKIIRTFTAFGRGTRLYLHSGNEVFAVDLTDND
jgi:hypothetical protein